MSSPLDVMIRSGDYKLLFDVIKAFRNGVVYGIKVRAPHALVMNFLWSKGSYWEIPEKVYRAAKQHGLNLGFTALCFKLVQAAIRLFISGSVSVAASPRAEAVISFVSGLVAGGLFWGEQNPINSQVSMYLLSRVLSGLLFTAVKRFGITLPPNAFRMYSALMWGLVMVLFMHEPDSLQTSLQSSMGYIYKESEKYTGFWDLVVVNSPQAI